MAEAFPTTQYW